MFNIVVCCISEGMVGENSIYLNDGRGQNAAESGEINLKEFISSSQVFCYFCVKVKRCV